MIDEDEPHVSDAEKLQMEGACRIMRRLSLATGHGDTLEDLEIEAYWQYKELLDRLVAREQEIRELKAIIERKA
jgi:hypothetical protein